MQGGGWIVELTLMFIGDHYVSVGVSATPK